MSALSVIFFFLASASMSLACSFSSQKNFLTFFINFSISVWYHDGDDGVKRRVEKPGLPKKFACYHWRMKITIPVSPVSVNEAHYGPHIKTEKCRRYEREVSFLLPFNPREPEPGEYFVKYIFYLKNYGGADAGNFEKLLTDILVKRGYLKDDRYIKGLYIQKERVKTKAEERIVLDIVLYKDRMSVMDVL